MSASKPATINADPFRFKVADVEYELPSFASIEAGLVRRIRNLDELDAMFTLLEAITDEATLAALDSMTVAEFGEFADAWKQHAGVDAPN